MKLNCRLAEAKDAEKSARWATCNGNPVSTAYNYPSAITVAVDEEEEPVLFQTAHPVLMLEALVVKPGLSTRRSARAIKELYEAMKRVSKQFGLKEMYFFSEKEGMQKMVEKHAMFEKVNMPVYRCIL